MGLTISRSASIQGNSSHVGGRGREVGGRLGETAVGGGTEAAGSPNLGRSRKAVLKMLGEMSFLFGKVSKKNCVKK